MSLQNVVAAMLAHLEVKQGMIDRQSAARQLRLMLKYPEKAHLLLTKAELNRYHEIVGGSDGKGGGTVQKS